MNSAEQGGGGEAKGEECIGMRGTGREGERGVAVTLLGSGASETNIMGLFVYIVGAVQRGGV